MPGWYVRRAIPADAEQLEGFSCRNVGEKWTTTVERGIRRELAPMVAAGEASPRVVVADCDGEVIGVACFTASEGETTIELLAVVHRYRRQGVGTRLKEAVMVQAAHLGCGAIASEVHRRNHAMLQLNRKLGIAESQHPDDGEYRLCTTLVELDEGAAPLTGD